MNAKSTALIVVDMNRAHLDQDLKYLPVSPTDSKRILNNVVNVVLPTARNFKCPVIYVKTIHRINPYTGEPMSKLNPFWSYQMNRSRVPGVEQKRKSLAVEGNIITELMPELIVRDEDLIVVKQRYSPFIGTDLDQILKALSVKSLILVGVNTNNCVLSTAFEAFNRDLEVVLIEDCCASMNGQEAHEFAVKQIKSSLGWVIQSSELELVLSGKMSL